MIAIRTQIATAVRWANVVYERLDDDQARDTFAAIWDALERKVNTAEAAGELAAVETAIADWRQTVAGRFEEVTK